jgi:hypothetical protein
VEKKTCAERKEGDKNLLVTNQMLHRKPIQPKKMKAATYKKMMTYANS